MSEVNSFLDNQEVTAETLNDIAIDLGSVSFSGFNQEKFGVEELNRITSDIVSAGILSSYNKCAPSIVDGMLCIDTGVLVFPSGVKKKITERIYMEFINDSYVYAYHDTIFNTCRIVVSDTIPSDGEYINIAQITEDGELKDERSMAKAKVTLPTEANTYSLTKEFDLDNVTDYNDETLTINTEGVSKIFILTTGAAKEDGTSSHASHVWSLYQYDVETQNLRGAYIHRNGAICISGSINSQFDLSLAYVGYSSNSAGIKVINISIIEQTENAVTFSFYGTQTSNYKFNTKCITKFYVYGGV